MHPVSSIQKVIAGSSHGRGRPVIQWTEVASGRRKPLFGYELIVTIFSLDCRSDGLLPSKFTFTNVAVSGRRHRTGSVPVAHPLLKGPNPLSIELQTAVFPTLCSPALSSRPAGNGSERRPPNPKPRPTWAKAASCCRRTTGATWTRRGARASGGVTSRLTSARWRARSSQRSCSTTCEVGRWLLDYFRN